MFITVVTIKRIVKINSMMMMQNIIGFDLIPQPRTIKHPTSTSNSKMMPNIMIELAPLKKPNSERRTCVEVSSNEAYFTIIRIKMNELIPIIKVL
tara:strand:- start:245 stop:529 length:285 start_codon:yes stop_codon:yes gene_type:complete